MNKGWSRSKLVECKFDLLLVQRCRRDADLHPSLRQPVHIRIDILAISEKDL